MITKSRPTGQLSLLMPTLREQLNSKHGLYILSETIDWQVFEDAFIKHYSPDFGCPAKPIRLMVSLIILKHLKNLSDAEVIESWSENVYYQYFSGVHIFIPGAPCAESELTHFRQRIGEEGCALILKESMRVNGVDAREKNLIADTTVQEKNITFPTDTKLHVKIIKKCNDIAEKENIVLRQTYTQTVKKLRQKERFRNHPKTKKEALKAARKIKTIAGRLVRELDRKLTPGGGVYGKKLTIFKQVLSQSRETKNKIYSLHEPDVQCISKGKEHKKYEFGSKVSILITQNTNVIVGALNLQKNCYDGHSLEPALEQYKSLTGEMPLSVTADKGYRGKKQIEQTLIHIPRPLSVKTTKYQKKKVRKRFARRAAVEPMISHLKQDYRLGRNFYKGIYGDNINVILAAAAMNFKRMINKWKQEAANFLASFWRILFLIPELSFATMSYSFLYSNQI